MPFRFSYVKATFQLLMIDVFRLSLRKFALVSFDVILIYSKD